MGLLKESTMKKLREEMKEMYLDIPDDEFNQLFSNAIEKIENDLKENMYKEFKNHVFTKQGDY